MRATFLIGMLALSGLLVACTGVLPPMGIEEVEQKPSAIGESGVELEPIELAAVVYNLKRGTKIGIYLNPGFFKQCVGPGIVYWNRGRVDSRDLELTDLFYDSLSQANYLVVGDPEKIFGQADDPLDATFSVGAQIKEIRMNVCEEASSWDGSPLNRQKGEAWVKVNWQVYSKLARRVVYQTTTEGYGKIDEGVPSGERILIQHAFASAADNLAADSGFRDVLIARDDVEPVEVATYSTEVIPKRKPFKIPIAENIAEVIGATVTISLGDGHGSGFVISADGLILTNHHVAGQRKRVVVEFPSGLSIEGEVLRTHAQRDVALIRVPVRGLRVLPIRDEPARIGEVVYAIGTPIRHEFRASLTRGIVSAWRKDKQTRLENIQSDVDIQGGNSGGPLVDARGNVIGISMSGLGGKFSVGLNFFIPIHDALAKLNLKIADK